MGEVKEIGLGKGRSWIMLFKLNELLGQPHRELSSWDELESKHLGLFISIVFRCRLYWEESMTLGKETLISQRQIPEGWQLATLPAAGDNPSVSIIMLLTQCLSCPLECKFH